MVVPARRTPMSPPRPCAAGPRSAWAAIRQAVWRQVRRADRAVHARTARQRDSGWAQAIRSAARLASTAVRPRQGSFVLSDYGVWLRERPRDATYRMCLLGSYGADLVRILDARHEPFCFVDVGANVGVYSLVALDNRACVAVRAFEPDPLTVPFLRDNLARRGSERWEVHPVALAAAPGHGRLATTAGHSGASTMRRAGDPDAGLAIRLVDGRFLAECLHGLTAPLVVKIDVEGCEHEVLAGLLPYVGPRIAMLWIEFSRATDRGACVALLTAHGFEEQLIVGRPRWYDACWMRAAPAETVPPARSAAIGTYRIGCDNHATTACDRDRGRRALRHSPQGRRRSILSVGGSLVGSHGISVFRAPSPSCRAFCRCRLGALVQRPNLTQG